MTTAMATTINDGEPLTAHDRCDQCGVQARVKATKGSKTLLFCQHHADDHADSLVKDGWLTVTERPYAGPNDGYEEGGGE